MEVKGVTWDFDGNQLSIRSALALAYAQGKFRGRDLLVTCVSVMCAESQRYAKAWHVNHKHEKDGVTNVEPLVQLSVDNGIMQISRSEYTYDLMDPTVNMQQARQLYKDRGWQPWAAYNSGAYLKFWDEVAKVYDRGAWRLSIPRWTI